MAKKQKQVTVDEAVVAKGGKPGFLKELADATGATAVSEKQAEALEHFDRRTVDSTRMYVDISSIRPMANNPRSELGDVEQLVRSIETNGFIGALSVREIDEAGKSVYEVWAGNRRLAAAKQAGLTQLPCDVYELTAVQALELNLTEQINRSDLTPLDEGEACRYLMELSGYSVAQVALKLGQSASWVTKRVALCGLAAEVRKALTKGETSLTVAQALAALPSQKAQAEALKALAGRPEWERRNTTAEAEVDFIRERMSRPLAGASWKLTDELLVSEAGACSVCPHNSATARMLGLFDNPKAKPSCANVACFENKARAAWTKKAEKAAAGGAKVLGLAEGKKLLPRGDLPYSSRYVKADVVVQEDKGKRTWKQLIEEVPTEQRPQLHLAQGGDGAVYELYVGDAALAAVAKHLKARWAVAKEEAEVDRAEKMTPARQDAERQLRDARDAVKAEVLAKVTKGLSKKFTLPAARFIATRMGFGERTLERFSMVFGKKLGTDWFEKGATMDELLACVWHEDADDQFSTYQGFGEDFIELAESSGLDVEAMVKAQLEGKAAA
jgi:ParB/RepB/Spo0J family partition protein